MNSIQFKNIDLNLFRVLLTLLDHGSVSRAASELALTPSAVSHALKRLRLALDDPLFERGGRGLVPTARALEIGRSIRPAIKQLREAVEARDFDPREADREFIVAAGPYATTILIPPLINRLAETAPGVRLRIRRLEEQSVEDLELGQFDVLLSGPAGLKPDLGWRPLLKDEMVWVARAGHPLVHAPLTTDMLIDVRHVIIEKFGTVFGPAYPEVRKFFDETPELRDASTEAADRSHRILRRPTGAVVVDITHALAIVACTDFVSLTLRRVAEAYGPSLQLLTPPHDTPVVELGAMYLPEHNRDPGFRWLLDQLEQCCRPSQPGNIKDTGPDVGGAS